jgi:hypothetical protein
VSNPTLSHSLPASGYCRDLPTKTLLDEYECWSWDFAQVDDTWEHAEESKAYIEFRINQIADEINHRQKLRDNPLSPRWPSEVPDRRHDLDAIKQHFPLRDFIERYTPVQFAERGDRLLASCPFLDHSDTTPSFYVYPDDHFFCYGCGRGGDLFEFARHFFGLGEFKDAADLLAQMAGIKKSVPEVSPFPKGNGDRGGNTSGNTRPQFFKLADGKIVPR